MPPDDYASPEEFASRNDGKKRPKGRKIPFPPGREEPLPALRQWVSDAGGLPPEVRIEAVIRPGPEPENALTIVLSNGLTMRCPHQSRLQQARTLQAFLASASDGIAMPPYLSPTEVGDFYTALCRLGVATAHEDPVADLHERLVAYVPFCERVHGSLVAAERYRTIETLKLRGVYDRAAAEGRSHVVPVVLIDGVAQRRYIRASEWLAWLRYSQGSVVDAGLAARMAELGSERVDPQAWNGDRSRKIHLVLYSLPENV